MWTVSRKERALPVPGIELQFVCRPARSLVSTTTATGCDVSGVILWLVEARGEGNYCEIVVSGGSWRRKLL